MVTEKQLIELKKEAEKGKHNFIEATTTLNEVNRNISAYEKELEELGVDPKKSKEWLEQKEQEIQEQYNQVLAMFPSQKNLI